MTTQPKPGHVRSTKALFDQQPFQQQRQQQRSAVNQPFQQQRSAGDEQFGRSWTKGMHEQYWTLFGSGLAIQPPLVETHAQIHTHTHARTHARTQARTHARTHTHTHTVFFVP